MSNPGERHGPDERGRRRDRRKAGRPAWLAAGAAVAAAILLGTALVNPKAAAAGWLVGFSFWSEVLVGSLSS